MRLVRSPKQSVSLFCYTMIWHGSLILYTLRNVLIRFVGFKFRHCFCYFSVKQCSGRLVKIVAVTHNRLCPFTHTGLRRYPPTSSVEGLRSLHKWFLGSRRCGCLPVCTHLGVGAAHSLGRFCHPRIPHL